MAWDTEQTRRRLKAAATTEFAAHGPHGTTMTRIATRAGINKERLYNYFGDKATLFATVLSDELEKVAAAVPLSDLRTEDVGEFAGRTFDYHATHPELARLLHWEGLTDTGTVPDDTTRTDYYQQKVNAFAAAQREGILTDELDPAHLVFLIIALAAWWFAVPQMVRMLTTTDNHDNAELTRWRAAVVHAARRLALPADHEPTAKTHTQPVRSATSNQPGR